MAGSVQMVIWLCKTTCKVGVCISWLWIYFRDYSVACLALHIFILIHLLLCWLVLRPWKVNGSAFFVHIRMETFVGWMFKLSPYGLGHTSINLVQFYSFSWLTMLWNAYSFFPGSSRSMFKNTVLPLPILRVRESCSRIRLESFKAPSWRERWRIQKSRKNSCKHSNSIRVLQESHWYV